MPIYTIFFHNILALAIRSDCSKPGSSYQVVMHLKNKQIIMYVYVKWVRKEIQVEMQRYSDVSVYSNA